MCLRKKAPFTKEEREAAEGFIRRIMLVTTYEEAIKIREEMVEYIYPCKATPYAVTPMKGGKPMKRTMLVLVACLLVVMQVVSVAETIDFSAYSDDELIQLLHSVQQEIASRNIEKTAELRAGTYVVGRDLPAGSYIAFMDNRSVMYQDIVVTSAEGKRKYSFTVYQEGFAKSDGTGEFSLRLEEGDTLRCTYLITLRIDAGVLFK